MPALPGFLVLMAIAIRGQPLEQRRIQIAFLPWPASSQFFDFGNGAAALAGHYLKNFSVLPVFQGVVNILSPSGISAHKV
jgi:hypothetical protein